MSSLNNSPNDVVSSPPPPPSPSPPPQPILDNQTMIQKQEHEPESGPKSNPEPNTKRKRADEPEHDPKSETNGPELGPKPEPAPSQSAIDDSTVKRKREEEPELGPKPELNPSQQPILDDSTVKRKPEDEPEHGPKSTQSPNAAVSAPIPQPEPGPTSEQGPYWKTSLCSYFRSKNNSCSHGETCRYAHGEAELRIRPDKTWDPNSERGKEEAKEDEGELEEEEDDVMMTEAIGDDDDDEEKVLAKCLGPLPIRWVVEDLRAFLESQGISFRSAKKKRGMVVGFLHFENSEQVKAAVKGLEGKVAGNKTVKLTELLPRCFEKKQADGSVSTGSKGRTARSVVTPLSHLSYPDQLEQKTDSLKQILKRLTRNGRKACPKGVELPEWIKNSKEIGGLPCKFEGIIESPIIEGYRNKCEFSVGYSLQRKPTVGFSLGNFREGVTAVGEPTDCPNVTSIACRYAAIFQEVIQNSALPIWNRLNNTGFWRQLTVREGRMPAKTEDAERSVSEVLLMVQVSMSGCDEELVKNEFEKMTEAFSQGTAADSSPLPLTALVIQDHRGISNVAPSDAPLHCLPVPRKETELISENKSDEGAIHDYISNLKFQISATAFFQVNTLAAEKLYALAGDWADLGPDTLLFDVCCGTGTIGLTLAHRVGMVVGIESNASAVADAHRNAEINGIKNCSFVCAKAEDVMKSLLQEYLDTSQKDELTNVTENNDEESKISNEEVGCTELQSTESNPSSSNNGPTGDGVPQKDFATKNMSGSGRRFKNIVAIVDPPRSGLHPTVLKVLRTHERLKRLVYISCNPETLMANAIELCAPCADKAVKSNDNRGWRKMSSASLARHRMKSMPNSEPFKPVKAMAVDIFPHTPHCELVMLLER